MKRKATATTAIAAILFCSWAAASAETAATLGGTATVALAAERAPSNMVEWIVAIRSAKDVASAAKCYAQARTLDKDDVELYEEYMNKMLTLGHPKIAFYPAMELRRLKAENGTAWGVLGYNDAKRGKYLTGFMAAIRAMQLLPDDPGIQNNAGILVAWYETRPLKPKLTETYQALLTEGSQKWPEKAKFAEAHSKSKSEFAARVERIEELKAEVAPADKAAKAAASESSQAADRYRKYARAVANLQDDVRALNQAYERASRYRRTDTYSDRYRRYALRSEISSKISAKQSQIYSLKRSGRSLRTLATKRAGLAKETKQALDKAKAALRAVERAKLSLTWIPPAVDGVITPESEKPATFTGGSGPTSKPSAGAPEVQLKMAKLLLQNNRTHKARAILELIIKKYPDSKAAKEAAELLKKSKSMGIGDL